MKSPCFGEHSAVWKFHDFSVREINSRDFGYPKTAILTHLEDLNFDFCEFLNFLEADVYPNQKFISPKIEKMAFSELSQPPKLISRKI